MNTKYLDINQNLKNSFLTDSLQSKSAIIGRESNEKREGDRQDLKNIHLCIKIPYKNRAHTFLEILFLQHFNMWISLLLCKAFTSSPPFLLPELLFYSWGLFKKVANRGTKSNNQHTPAHYCQLPKYFL